MWFGAKYFYDKSVTVVNASTATYNRGILVKGEDTTSTIDCDVQPTNKIKMLKEYGIETDAEYTMYCDVNSDIKLSSKITYNDVSYDVYKIIKWDDYMIVLFGRID